MTYCDKDVIYTTNASEMSPFTSIGVLWLRVLFALSCCWARTLIRSHSEEEHRDHSSQTRVSQYFPWSLGVIQAEFPRPTAYESCGVIGGHAAGSHRGDVPSKRMQICAKNATKRKRASQQFTWKSCRLSHFRLRPACSCILFSTRDRLNGRMRLPMTPKEDPDHNSTLNITCQRIFCTRITSFWCHINKCLWINIYWIKRNEEIWCIIHKRAVQFDVLLWYCYDSRPFLSSCFLSRSLPLSLLVCMRNEVVKITLFYLKTLIRKHQLNCTLFAHYYNT